ncbi:MAG: sulfite oxidase [Pseudomonadota bacterium]
MSEKDRSTTRRAQTPSATRREILKATVGLAAGSGLSFGALGSAYAADRGDGLAIKQGLDQLNDRPVNMQALPHLLDDNITPPENLFVRNNGVTMVEEDVDVDSWRLEIDGEVESPLSLSINDLRENFENVTLQLVLECAGNGRRFFHPGASGNQWAFGAVGCAEWTGVRLRDVLEAAGLKSSAVYTGHYGADLHLSRDPAKQPISRGVPIDKALEPHNLIAWRMGEHEIPMLNGYPLRLVIPGWPASCSQKWLNRITIRDRVHDGAKMGGYSYRVPKTPVPPGTTVAESDMKIIESMPVKSLITFPETGEQRTAGQPFEVRGHAWAGDLSVADVHVSTDYGATWQQARLDNPVNKYAWQRWRANVTLPQTGYFEVWARATDSNGHMQPATTPAWNPRGYLNNMQHRIAIFSG